MSDGFVTIGPLEILCHDAGITVMWRGTETICGQRWVFRRALLDILWPRPADRSPAMRGCCLLNSGRTGGAANSPEGA